MTYMTYMTYMAYMTYRNYLYMHKLVVHICLLHVYVVKGAEAEREAKDM